jgi:hypothetical protein
MRSNQRGLTTEYKDFAECDYCLEGILCSSAVFGFVRYFPRKRVCIQVPKKSKLRYQKELEKFTSEENQ